jgi:hypothetical protein
MRSGLSETALQGSGQKPRGGSDDTRHGTDEEGHEESRGSIFPVSEHQNDPHPNRDEADHRESTPLDGSQRLETAGREALGGSEVSEQLEGPEERQKEGGGTEVDVRQEGIVEVDLKERGLGIPALDVGLPEEEGEGACRKEHDHPLKQQSHAFLGSGDARPHGAWKGQSLKDLSALGGPFLERLDHALEDPFSVVGAEERFSGAIGVGH